MTADERIEKLLNRFGQTISDLPKPDRRLDRLYGPYASETRLNYYHAAREWSGWDSRTPDMAIADYACHLCDVIDRMEIALETATMCASCFRCSNSDYCDGFSCDFRIDDERLSDVSEEDAERYINDAD